MSNMIEEQIAKVLYTSQAIQAKVKKLGERISYDYSEGGLARDPRGLPPILVCVLRGALMFMADLLRQLPIAVECDYIQVASYGDGTAPGAVRLINDLDGAIQERDVLIVEDIVDSGYTINYLRRNLSARKPASLRICTLIDKVSRREDPVDISYTGFVLEQNVFIVGYGMDYAGMYRNLPYIGLLKGENG